MVVAVKSPVSQAQHAWLKACQQWPADIPFGSPIRPQMSAQDGMGSTLGQHSALRLGVTGLTGAAARIAESLGVGGLVRNLEITAVYGYQSQPSVKGMGLRLD